MNSMIELHDSKVAVISHVGEQVIVFFSHAYIHTSEGRPGVDKGSGYWQAAALVFTNGTVESDGKDMSDATGLDGDIWDGDVEIEDHIFQNSIPVPFNHTGAVTLKLHIDVPAKVTISGQKAVLTLIGEAVYVEQFPGAD